MNIYKFLFYEYFGLFYEYFGLFYEYLSNNFLGIKSFLIELSFL